MGDLSRTEVATKLKMEAAYRDWSDGMAIEDIAAKHDRSVSTIQKWRADGKWAQRSAIARLEAMSSDRERTDAALAGHMPEIMLHAIRLALGTTSTTEIVFGKDGVPREREVQTPAPVQAQMTKYLLGTLGYSPEASVQWLQAMDAKLAQMKEQTAARSEADGPKDYATIFSDAVDMGAIPGPYSPNASNGPEASNDDPLDDALWPDDR